MILGKCHFGNISWRLNLEEAKKMVLGISPMVDYAFKMIFGSPENTKALIGLLNAVLQLTKPVVQVEIRNPFNRKEFEDCKVVVLDVRCRDSTGRWFNVEMQVTTHRDILKRMTFYVCSMYTEQAREGDQYSQLQPAISICLLKDLLFKSRNQAHHRFQLSDRESGEIIEDTIEVHTLELAKYNLDDATIGRASQIEKWAFLLMYAQDYSAKQLKELLSDDEFSGAIETIEVISAKKEDREMYDQRSKAQRDYEWGLASARQEGRQEGQLIGRILTIQELLGDSVSSTEELEQLTMSVLSNMLDQLQLRMRNRQA